MKKTWVLLLTTTMISLITCNLALTVLCYAGTDKIQNIGGSVDGMTLQNRQTQGNMTSDTFTKDGKIFVNRYDKNGNSTTYEQQSNSTPKLVGKSTNGRLLDLTNTQQATNLQNINSLNTAPRNSQANINNNLSQYATNPINNRMQYATNPLNNRTQYATNPINRYVTSNNTRNASGNNNGRLYASNSTIANNAVPVRYNNMVPNSSIGSVLNPSTNNMIGNISNPISTNGLTNQYATNNTQAKSTKIAQLRKILSNIMARIKNLAN